MSAPELSIVIPVYNEQLVLPMLAARLFPALDTLGRSYEVLFVDDGSRDGSADELRRIQRERSDVVRVLLLRFNVGQHLAILAAFERVRGRHTITLDADLQNPPEEIGRVVAELDAGHDYVGTVRQLRRDVWWRRAASAVINGIRDRITPIRITDQGCMLRGYGRNVIDAVNACDESSTFVPALAYGFATRRTEIPVAHEERAAGETKYSVYRLVRLNFDLMTGFSLVPLQMVSLVGLLVSLASLVLVVVLALRRLLLGPEAQGLFTLFGIVTFLMGVMLFGLGIVGEYIGRIYQQVRRRPRYMVLESPGDAEGMAGPRGADVP
ncbi:MAG: glycosyltransferase [Gammaproteobacteria bacterium]|nr:glycosyltransferase [Gammaproteobacteria bacterium]